MHYILWVLQHIQLQQLSEITCCYIYKYFLLNIYTFFGVVDSCAQQIGCARYFWSRRDKQFEAKRYGVYFVGSTYQFSVPACFCTVILFVVEYSDCFRTILKLLYQPHLVAVVAVAFLLLLLVCCTRTHTCSCTHTHIHTHTRAHTHVRTRTRTIYTFSHTHIHTLAQTHTSCLMTRSKLQTKPPLNCLFQNGGQHIEKVKYSNVYLCSFVSLHICDTCGCRAR